MVPALELLMVVALVSAVVAAAATVDFLDGESGGNSNPKRRMLAESEVWEVEGWGEGRMKGSWEKESTLMKSRVGSALRSLIAPVAAGCLEHKQRDEDGSERVEG